MLKKKKKMHQLEASFTLCCSTLAHKLILMSVWTDLLPDSGPAASD